MPRKRYLLCELQSGVSNENLGVHMLKYGQVKHLEHISEAKLLYLKSIQM